MSRPRPDPRRRLSRLEGERRSRAGLGEASWMGAVRRDVAVHDAVRLLGLVPADGPASGYDARGPELRYRIAGHTPEETHLAAGSFRPEGWDRGLLVSMTAELEPMSIDELTFEAACATRCVARLRAAGRRCWVLG